MNMIHNSQELVQKVFKSHEACTDCLKACELAIEAQNVPQTHVVYSSTVALILADLNLDKQTLIATLISDGNLEPLYSIEKIEALFDASIAKLVSGIRQLNEFKEFHTILEPNEIQHERLRQMLLSMTSDVRIMIVKLAYRVARLRHLKFESEEARHQIALETELIFAPLANRLGIASLKWELEDLSFRFLNPEIYKSIAKQLAAKRVEREAYIQNILSIFKDFMDESNIPYQISGRPKHIYSIWKKMTRKQLPIDELYDLRAIRIYVETVQQCYEVLGLIHSRWNYIKEEFDDYIASPKDNGYQSIHTVIIGPENKTVEIQIRTHEMHYTSEYGVAAHWRYKEGGHSIDPKLEKSINLVRQMLEYNDDPDLLNQISTELLSEHIYIMTPQNEIITMSKGTTVLDFAYQIHTELGHQCRGAKRNGRIVPLTTQLKTGDKIEILTLKNGTPSRNWLNPNLGYLGSSRSRAKVRHWFNQQNKETNIEMGEAIFNKEIKRLHAHNIDLSPILERFNVTSEKQLFEGLGKGQFNEGQLANIIQKQVQAQSETIQHLPKKVTTFNTAETDEPTGNAFVVGAPQLKTKLAPCCQPKPGDTIIGYVTRGHGITVHCDDCMNILNLTYEESQRLIEVAWSQEETVDLYKAQLVINAFDRKGLLLEIMQCLLNNDINLLSSSTQTDEQERDVTMVFDIEFEEDTHLAKLMDEIEAIKNINQASIKTH